MVNITSHKGYNRYLLEYLKCLIVTISSLVKDIENPTHWYAYKQDHIGNIFPAKIPLLEISSNRTKTDVHAKSYTKTFIIAPN